MVDLVIPGVRVTGFDIEVWVAGAAEDVERITILSPCVREPLDSLRSVRRREVVAADCDGVVCRYSRHLNVVITVRGSRQ